MSDGRLIGCKIATGIPAFESSSGGKRSMNRLRLPEIVLGFGLGIVVSLFVGLAASYQAERCAQPASVKHESVFSNQPLKLADKREHENRNSRPISCDFSGFLWAILGFMNDNEGSFVVLSGLRPFFCSWRQCSFGDPPNTLSKRRNTPSSQPNALSYSSKASTTN
jgi:hypothetical protein